MANATTIHTTFLGEKPYIYTLFCRGMPMQWTGMQMQGQQGAGQQYNGQGGQGGMMGYPMQQGQSS